MSNKSANISQIKKYLNNELDAHAMHQLEKQAQDDPFLMDALEGYQTAGIDQRQLDELHDRLQQRIDKKQGRIIPWRVLAMAASVIVVLTIGGLWMYKQQSPTKTLLAQADKTEVQPSPVIQVPQIAANKDSIIRESMPVAVLKPKRQISLRRNRAAANEMESAPSGAAVSMLSATLDKEEHPVATRVAKKDSVPLNEMLVMGYAEQNNAPVKSAAKQIKVDSTAHQTALSEVAVVKSKDSKAETHPQTGWKNFESYLKDEAISADGKTGMVTLQFMVNSDGTLSDFKVTKSLSDAADQRAIALIKNGPGWIGEPNGQSKQITVKVRFHKAD